MDGTIYSLGLFLDEIATYMDTLPTRVAYASSILLGINLLIAPLICGLTNKYGFRIIAFSGGILGSAVLIASSYLKKLYVFLLIMGVLGGTACASIYVPSVVIVGFYFERWRALASAMSVCGSSCGIIFFPLILNNILDGYHWTEKFRILSLAFLLISLLSLTFRPLPSIGIHCSPEQDDSVLSVYLGGDHGAVLSRLYSHYNNPTNTEIREAISQSQHPQNVKKDFSSSSTLVATSGYPGGSSTAISKMSTVFEDDRKITFKDRCQGLWISLCNNCRWCCGCYRIGKTMSTQSRPMYRDDIFFTGSVYTLPDYPKRQSMKGNVSSAKPSIARKSTIDYHISVSRMATQRDVEEEHRTCVCCTRALKTIITTMLDMKLLKSVSFLCLSISGFLVALGMYVPFVYIVQKGIENGMNQKLAATMLTGLGIANLCGRILSGMLASLPQVNALVVTYVGLFIGGIPTIFFAFAEDLWMYYMFVALFGSTIATVPTMKTIILVDLLGLDKLTNAFGITLMFQGFASFIGLPIASYFVEYTNSYNASFIYCGCTTILSAIVLIPIKCIKSWEIKKTVT